MKQKLQAIPIVQSPISMLIFSSYSNITRSTPYFQSQNHAKDFEGYADRIAILDNSAFTLANKGKYSYLSIDIPRTTLPVYSRCLGDHLIRHDYKFCLLYFKHDTPFVLFADKVKDFKAMLTKDMRPIHVDGITFKVEPRKRLLRLLSKVRSLATKLLNTNGTGRFNASDMVETLAYLTNNADYDFDIHILIGILLSLEHSRWDEGESKITFVANTEDLLTYVDKKNRIYHVYSKAACVNVFITTRSGQCLSSLGPKVLVTLSYDVPTKICKLTIVDYSFVDTKKYLELHRLYEELK